MSTDQKKKDQNLQPERTTAATNTKQHFTLSIVFKLLCLLAPVVLTTLIYSNTLQSPFVLDDLSAITGNPHIRISDVSADSLLSSIQGRASRPIPIISFALNYFWDGYNPIGYHLVNIGIHALTGILLFIFTNYTLSISTRLQNQSPWGLTAPGPLLAFLVACIWTAHPVNTQSVTYIVQRMNSLAALFSLLVFIFYLKGRQTRARRQAAVWFSLALGAWALALGCKETAASLPFAILLYEWYFFQDLSRLWLKRNLKYLIGGMVLFGALAFVYTGFDPLGKLSSLQDFSEARFTLSERALTQFRVVVYYLSLFFYPHPSRLNLDHDFLLSQTLIDPPTTLLSALFICGLLGIAIWAARRHRLISFCIFWFFLNLAIESTIIPLAIIFEHRTYLPFMGLALLMVLLVDRYVKPLWPKVILVALAVALNSVWTYQRNQVWENPIILWQDVIRKSPSKARPYANLGMALEDHNRVDEAIAIYETALNFEPYHAKILNNLGAIFRKQYRLEEAVRYFETALKGNPNQVEALTNLGSALIAQGQASQAIGYLRKALGIAPDYTMALNNLGTAYLDLDRLDEAAGLFESVLQIDSRNVTALNHQGLIHISRGELSRALEKFKYAATLEKDYAETYANLGAVYLTLGYVDKATLHLETALKLDPNIAQAHTNLGISLVQQENFQLGFIHLKKAIDLEPENKSTRVNYQRALDLYRQVEHNIAELLKANKADPRNTRILADLANLYQSIGNLDAATDTLNQALNLDPTSDALLNSLGNLYLARNQYQAAEGVFKKHLAQDPSFSLPYYNLARWSAKQGRTAEAVDWLIKAIARGYANWERITSDPDLESIRKTEEYSKLIKERKK